MSWRTRDGMTEHEAYIALNMIDQLGPVRVRSLVEALGSPQAILQAEADALMRAEGIGAELAQRIVAQRENVDPVDEEQRAARLDARLIAFSDPDYPEALKAIHDPPLALYVQGQLEPRDRHALALVGTRRPTHYGTGMARAWDRYNRSQGCAQGGRPHAGGPGECVGSDLSRGKRRVGCRHRA